MIDDIGILPAGQEAAEAFYRVVEAAYEKRSIAVTTTCPAGFDTIMLKALAMPAVNHLLHHAHLIVTEVSSRRLAEAVVGKRCSLLSEPTLGRNAARLPGHLGVH